MEVVFSFRAYLPIAFGCFALISLCCGGALPKLQPGKKLKTISLAVLSGWTVVYMVLLFGNIYARTIVDRPNKTFEEVDRAIAIDRFEWPDYVLSYLDSAADIADLPALRQKADGYAERLGARMSNTAPYYVAEYYFRTDQPEQAIAMLEKYVGFVSADERAWNSAFDLLEMYAKDEPLYRDGVRTLAEMLQDWNRENMASIGVDEDTAAFIAGMTEE